MHKWKPTWWILIRLTLNQFTNLRMLPWWRCLHLYIPLNFAPFASLPVVIYEDTVLDFYAHKSVNPEKKIFDNFNGKTYMFDEALFLMKVKVLYVWIFHLCVLQEEGDEDGISNTNGLVSKAPLVKDSSFDASTREIFLVMAVIPSGVKINWSTMLYTVLVDMITKDATGFAIHISKFLVF